MEFQNIKHERIYLHRWTFSTHTFSCTSTNPLTVSWEDCSHQCLHGLAVLLAWMFFRYFILASRFFSHRVLSGIPPTFCSAASCTSGPAAFSPVTLAAWSLFQLWLHSSVRFWESESLPRSFSCDSLGAQPDSWTWRRLVPVPPQSTLEGIRLCVSSLVR